MHRNKGSPISIFGLRYKGPVSTETRSVAFTTLIIQYCVPCNGRESSKVISSTTTDAKS